MINIPITALKKKIIISVLIASIGIASYTALIDSMLKKVGIIALDEKGEKYIDETMSRAIYTFAVVRGINGVISVIQGTDISATPAGVGVKFAVGEILDPVNDLVERFSWVMLLSTISLGIQKVLMDISQEFGFRILLSIAMLMILSGIWASPYIRFDLKSWGYKLIIVSLIIRFSISFVAIVSDYIYDLFLKDKYYTSVKSLEKVRLEIADAAVVEDKQENDVPDDLINMAKRMYQQTAKSIDIESRIIALKDKISEYAAYTVDLIIVFLLQTLIIPIFVLWLFVRLILFTIYDLRFVSNRKS